MTKLNFPAIQSTQLLHYLHHLFVLYFVCVGYHESAPIMMLEEPEILAKDSSLFNLLVFLSDEMPQDSHQVFKLIQSQTFFLSFR